MKVIDPGHWYRLDTLDGEFKVELRFVKRIGDKFPGNEAPGYAGTTTQEVIRALLDRARYVSLQQVDYRNELVINHLREALRILEIRAADRRGDIAAVNDISRARRPDELPTCDTCGHCMCSGVHE